MTLKGHANIRINLILPETIQATFLIADSMGLSSRKFLWLAPKDAHVLKHECVMALQGHPRSLILAPIESAYATSYWSSIVILVLSCPVSEILQVFC